MNGKIFKKKYLKLYYDFFDKKLGDSPFVVALIGVIIFVIGYIGPASYGSAYSNVLQYNNQKLTKNIIEIGGKKYELILKEI